MTDTDGTSRAPNIFSRGGLNLTYELIRKINPSLALAVRNITQGAPVSVNSSEQLNEKADCFEVDLDSFQVRAVVEALVERTQSSQMESTGEGQAIVAAALLEDWMCLARKMIEDLPDDQKPLG